MVAAVNAGLERGLFTMQPGDDRWPALVVQGRRDPFVFPFEFPNRSTHREDDRGRSVVLGMLARDIGPTW